jgi:hypothetical protein
MFFIGRPISEVVNSNLDEPFVDGFGQEALGQVPGKDLWEEGHDIDPQGSLHRARVRGVVVNLARIANEGTSSRKRKKRRRRLSCRLLVFLA